MPFQGHDQIIILCTVTKSPQSDCLQRQQPFWWSNRQRESMTPKRPNENRGQFLTKAKQGAWLQQSGFGTD